MRLAALAKGGYYPTPLRVVDLVAQVLYGARGHGRSADTLRVLDPCCGAGDALAQFAGLLQDRSTVPVETFGVELHRERAEQAAEVLDRVLSCDLFATTIANNAFGVLLLNPPYDWDKEDKRVEHAFLTHTTRYLTDGGLLPVHRAQAAAGSIRPLPVIPLPGHPVLGLPEPGARVLRPGGPGGKAQGRTQPRPLRRANRCGAGPLANRRSSLPAPTPSTTQW